jgi:hypothetical protein
MKLASFSVSALLLALVVPELATAAEQAIPYDPPRQSLGITRNRIYHVQYPTAWETYRFPTEEQARAHAIERGKNPSAETKLLPAGNTLGSPNTVVAVRYWVGNQEQDPHKAYLNLLGLRARGAETRVLLTYEQQASFEEQSFGELFDRTLFGTIKWIPKLATLPQLPPQFRLTETTSGTTVKGNWSVNTMYPDRLRGDWEDGSGGWVRLEQWEPTQLVFTRQDNSGPKDGLTARYVGRIMTTTLAGEVFYTWRGRNWQGTWNASAGLWDLTKQQVNRICIRGEPVLAHRGNAIAVSANAVSYTDPQTRVTNVIQWNLPPPTLTVGQEVTLLSWSTHNRGAPVEVHWETGGRRDHGADSEINEANKQSKLRFTGGAIELRGGIRRTRWDGPGHFTMRWPYTCTQTSASHR